MNSEADALKNQSTLLENKVKRPYSKITQELRSAILKALTVDRMPLNQVAEKYNTKACTCKAILLTFEHEGRAEKKCTRRERVEIETQIKVIIMDPLDRGQREFCEVKKSKMYSEEKELTLEEQGTLQKKLIQEVCTSLGEMQTSCYQLQQPSQPQPLTEKCPSAVMKGINMSLHVITSKIRENPVIINRNQKKVEQKQTQVQATHAQVHQQPQQNQETQNRFQEIKQFIDQVVCKTSMQPRIMEELRYLTNQTIFHSRVQQHIVKKDESVNLLSETIANSLKLYFNYLYTF